ncbi:tetratricopeptide repeat protein [Fibrobacter sp.]|uniref:tetratricopeptide repeat protein n=1 Tax=Fibrobacter sp. TaxID=35828 RepID=UPI0025C248F2|nr:tetratricopeptide repeat protein [Fibrobacter sp.]
MFVAVLFATVFCACNGNDMNRGDEALRIGDYKRAAKNFSKVLDKDPANRDARYGLAIAYYAIAEDKERLRVSTLAFWERTVREFKILSVVDTSEKSKPMYSTSLFYLARAMLAENAQAKVLPLLDQSIKLDPENYFSYNLKALILAGQGNTEEAKKIYAYIVTREPKFASAYVNLGNLYWNVHDYESAWDIWSMGHEALPQDAVLAKWTRVAEDSLKAMVYSGKL